MREIRASSRGSDCDQFQTGDETQGRLDGAGRRVVGQFGCASGNRTVGPLEHVAAGCGTARDSDRLHLGGREQHGTPHRSDVDQPVIRQIRDRLVLEVSVGQEAIGGVRGRKLHVAPRAGRPVLRGFRRDCSLPAESNRGGHGRVGITDLDGDFFPDGVLLYAPVRAPGGVADGHVAGVGTGRRQSHGNYVRRDVVASVLHLVDQILERVLELPDRLGLILLHKLQHEVFERLAQGFQTGTLPGRERGRDTLHGLLELDRGDRFELVLAEVVHDGVGHRRLADGVQGREGAESYALNVEEPVAGCCGISNRHGLWPQGF